MAIPATTNPQISDRTSSAPFITAYSVATSGGKLVVFVCYEYGGASQSVSAVSRNGQTFTYAGSVKVEGGGTDNYSECWYLDSPDVGSYDITTSFTNSMTNSSTIAAVYMTGAAAGGPDATSTGGTYTTSSGPYTASISPTVNDTLILAAIGSGARETLTVSGSGHTELASILESSGGVYLSASYKQAASSGANSVDWTSSGSNNRIAIFAAAWAGAGGASFQAAWAQNSNVILGAG